MTTSQIETASAARASLRHAGLKVYGALLFSVTAWGASFVAARYVLSSFIPGMPVLSPVLLATVRFLIASLVFGLTLLFRRQPADSVRRHDFALLALLGQIGISVYFWLQYTGVKLTNASVSSVLVVGLIPLATMLVSALARREKLKGRRTLALALGACGVLIVSSQQGFAASLETGFLLGSLCLVGNAFCFALYSTLMRTMRERYSSLVLTAAVTVSGTAGLLLASVFTQDWGSLLRLEPIQWGAVIYLSLVCSVLAYFLYNHALSYLEASKAAVWLYLEPVVAMLLGALLLGETVSLHTIAGGAAILLSLTLTQRT
jgi:drug/metabolite transporter (DMT)-like permease